MKKQKRRRTGSDGMTKTPVDPIRQAMDEAVASVERIEREGKAARQGGDADGNEDKTVEVEVPPTFDDPPAPAASAAPAPAAAAPAPEERLAEMKDQMLRLAADFDNFRKRTRREQDEQRKYGVEPVVRAVLPVLDNLERALKHAPSGDPMAQGVQMVARQFIDVLAGFGVRSFESLGARFDPERHEAVGQQPAGDAAPGTILEELERGYTLHDRLLRPARVLVAAAPAEAAGAGEGGN